MTTATRRRSTASGSEAATERRSPQIVRRVGWEAARRMGISLATIRAHLWRARKALRQQLAVYSHDMS